MSARTFADRADVRFRGKKPPVTFAAVPMLVSAAVGALFWFAGWRVDVRLVLLGGVAVFWTTGLYLLSIFHNYIALDVTNARVATWLSSPFKEQTVPYESIVEILTDETTGELTIKFVNQLGERDYTGLLVDKVSPSDVKDQIRIRLPRDVEPNVQPETPSPVIDQQDLPTGKDSMKFTVWRMPRWPWFLAAAAPVVATIVLIANGHDLTPLRIFGATVFFEAVALGIFAIFAGRRRLELRADKLIITHPRDYHRIRYEDIKRVTPYETGYLVVDYTKQPKLGLGGGDETASTRLLKHSESATAAAYILAAVERSKHLAN
jgi:hypothetical protein